MAERETPESPSGDALAGAEAEAAREAAAEASPKVVRPKARTSGKRPSAPQGERPDARARRRDG